MTTPAVLAHLSDDPASAFAFDHECMAIHNPTRSECGRFFASPDYYGFFIYQTGGGCTAWRRDFVLEDGRPCYMLVTAGDDATHEIEPEDRVTLGVYVDGEDDYIGWVCYEIDESGDVPMMTNVAAEGETF